MKLVSHKNGFSYQVLNYFQLAVGLSFKSINMGMGAHKRIENAKLIKKDVEFITGLAVETWDVSTDKG